MVEVPHPFEAKTTTTTEVTPRIVVEVPTLYMATKAPTTDDMEVTTRVETNAFLLLRHMSLLLVRHMSLLLLQQTRIYTRMKGFLVIPVTVLFSQDIWIIWHSDYGREMYENDILMM
ncbi:unnamed protein product [Vicia faba]|uniref:Uncharacterized protein n=1 Tax=Vicia faba TaxID=3906 RepID=A0AAV0ZZZ5_VICFA|nr:unnamed protein product [Vicia faba]